MPLQKLLFDFYDKLKSTAEDMRALIMKSLITVGRILLRLINYSMEKALMH